MSRHYGWWNGEVDNKEMEPARMEMLSVKNETGMLEMFVFGACSRRFHGCMVNLIWRKANLVF